MKLVDSARLPYVNLFIITFCLCILINSGSLNSLDTLYRLQVTHWIWTSASQVTPNTPDPAGMSAVGRGGQRFAHWGIGQSLVMLPGDMIATFLIKIFHLQKLSSVVDAGLVSYITFPPINAASICLACKILSELSFSRRESISGALALLFCTTMLPYAQDQQENSLMLLCLLTGLWGNLLWLRTGVLIYLGVGVSALGLGLLIRLPSIFDAASVFLLISAYLVIQSVHQKGFSRNEFKKLFFYAIVFAAFYIPFLIGDRLYQWFRFGSFTSNYSDIWSAQLRAINPNFPANFPFDNPFLVGFFGQMFSSDRSIFLFNPLLILFSFLLFRFWKDLEINVKLYTVAGVFLLLANIILYSKWFDWGGAAAWGPRFVLVPCEFLSLLAVPILIKFLSQMTSLTERIFCWGWVFISGVIQLSSVLFDANLELVQEEAFHKNFFVVIQRLINTWLLATGSFSTSGLTSLVSDGEIQKWTRLTFMPWRTEGQFPHQLTIILQISWVAGFCIFLFYLGFFVLRTFWLNPEIDKNPSTTHPSL